ncbi:MAG: hypothetical protein OXI80_07670 [Caldilineaceae bacterium]|nr:hypothetical protein [Caldilineaceae bacterium]MDE0337533.1 hypothetical protein [Caldilineaceae bacterium]
MGERVQTAGEQGGREREQRRSAWQEWLKESERLNRLILAETKGEPINVNLMLEATRADLEARDARISGDEA